MADVALLAAGAPSGYAAAIDKPAGLGSAACYFTLSVTWFYAGTSAPSLSGWTLLDWATDARGSDATTTAVFGKVVADASAEPSTVTFTPPSGGGDHKGQIMAWSNVDSADPVNDTSVDASEPADNVTLPASNVDVAGSLSLLACGSWNFNSWTGNTPTGYTQDAGGGGDEFGSYYDAGLSVGTVGPTFPSSGTNRFAVVQVVLQPSAGGGGSITGSCSAGATCTGTLVGQGGSSASLAASAAATGTLAGLK